jgi:hypothetical protein
MLSAHSSPELVVTRNCSNIAVIPGSRLGSVRINTHRGKKEIRLMRQSSEEPGGNYMPAYIRARLALFVTNAGIIASIVFVLGSTSARAQLTATFNNPTVAGKSSITVHAEVPGVAPNTIGTGGVKISPVQNVIVGGKVVSEAVDITIPIPAGADDIAKANAVAVGLIEAFGSAGVGRDPAHPTLPTIIMPKGSVFTVTADTTGEGAVTVAALNNAPAKFNIFQIDWANNPAGLDAFANASVFDVSFGYDGLTDSATVDASDLPSLTLASLDEALFAQLEAGLPSSLQGDLSIDTGDFGLTFLIPDGSNDPFINISTTDIDTVPLGGINDVQTPEPSSLLLAGTGLAGLVARLRRRVVS